MAARIDIFLALIERWKAKDIEAVLDYMDDDIVWHFAAGAEPPIRGKVQARKFLTRFGGQITDVNWRVFRHAEGDARLFVEGVDEYMTTDGVRVAAPYAGVIAFNGDRIVGWRDYVDVATIARQTTGTPVSAQVEELLTS